MGQFEVEWAEKVQRFLRDTEQRELTVTEILGYPRWQRVWWLWQYNEKYEGTPMPEDFPLELVKKIYGVD
jgi:nitrogen regulatory protein PII